MRQSQLTLGLIVVLALSGCAKEKRDAVIMGGGATSSGAATLSSLQSDVIRLSCATSGCHDSRATPAGSLDLSDASRSYANLVNRASTQAPALKLVNPGNPSASYLVNKLLGTHAGVGGSGVRMPQYSAPLASSDIERIETWITDGAPPN
jgi:hypothetical protein